MRRGSPGTAVVHDPETYVAGAPLAVLDELRETGSGVHWVEEPPAPGLPGGGPGYWLVTRYADVKAVLRDPATFSSHLGGTQVRDPATPEHLAYVRRMMLNMDPPEHTRLRRPMTHAFTMRAVQRLERRIAGHVAAILDRSLVQPGVVDFAKEVAADLPLLTLADVLGVPAADRMLLFDWSNRVIGFQDPDYATSAAFDPATGTELARQALRLRPLPGADGAMPDPRTREGMPDLYAYAHLLAEHKRGRPGDDVMSIWLAYGLDAGDRVSTEEFENMFWLFAVAGNETLRNGLPGGMHALLSHPEAQERLRAALPGEPELLDTAVEEMLRWWTPVMVFRRTATRATDVGAVEVEEGTKVVVSFLAANRDPRVFDAPEEFRIDRGGRQHLVFGHGPHLCLGAHLARVQLRAMFAGLLERTSWLEAAGEPALLRSSFQRGVKRLPVRWSA